jgi:hypothetical protein
MSNEDFEGFGPRPQSFEAPPPHPGMARTSGTAIASLVLGLLGCCGITAILGVILGFTSLGAIRRSRGMIVGRGLALTGIILGFVWIGLWAAFWRWPYAGYNYVVSAQTAVDRTGRFMEHLSRREYEDAIALTSERFREKKDATALRAEYAAALAKHGALREWKLRQQPVNEQDAETPTILLVHCDLDLVWEKGETRGRVTFRMDLEDLMQGPVDPFVEAFELE